MIVLGAFKLLDRKKPVVPKTNDILVISEYRLPSGKIIDRKLDHLEIRNLYPWHFYFTCVLPPLKKLYSKYSNHRLLFYNVPKEAFKSPSPLDEKLMDMGLIYFDRYARKPRESLEDFTRRKGYTYKNSRVTESDLLKWGGVELGQFDFAKFRKRLDYAKEASDPNTKERMFQDFRNSLRDLCYEPISWDEGVRGMIVEVLKLVLDNLTNLQFTEICLNYLNLILHKQDKQTTNLVKIMFLDRLEGLRRDSDFQKQQPMILHLLVQMKEYSEECLKEIINESPRLDKPSFQTLFPFLSAWLSELKIKDIIAYDRVKDHVFREMNKAGDNKETRTRFEQIFSSMS